jgi:phospho-N-acetylmuramoyl-pentapeptide-transferase
MSPLHIYIIKIFFLLAFSFFVTILWMPFLTRFLYKYRLWRRTLRTQSIDGKPVPVFQKFNKGKETGTPRLGGLLIWITTIFIAFLFSFLTSIFDNFWFQKLNFLSREQTWLPLAVLGAASLLGLADDILQIFNKGKYVGGGIEFTRRLSIILLIGVVGAWWFYFKLGFHTLYIPGIGSIEIGFWLFPFFILVMLACWGGGVIDGVDGLAGGVFAIIFGAFSIISFSQMQYNLSAFCAVIVGTILAFLWFNVPPARFYMSETGTIGLTSTLAVVSFLTDSVFILPIIAGLLVLEVGSVILQLLSKKFLKKKIFIAAPIHHHLQAKGWPSESITMRFWILGIVLAVIGVSMRLIN